MFKKTFGPTRIVSLFQEFPNSGIPGEVSPHKILFDESIDRRLSNSKQYCQRIREVGKK